MSGFLSEVLLLFLIGVGSALVVRYAVPPALRVITYVLAEALSIVAALLLVPDAVAASTSRRRSVAPPRWAYDYGDMVGGMALILNLGLGHVHRGLSELARSLPPVAVGVLAAGLRLLVVIS